MAQVVATRSIQSSFSSPSHGSLQSQVEKLKPPSFASKVLGRNERSNSCRAVRVNMPQIIARRSTRAEPQVLPVSPEDVPKVLHFFLFPAKLFILFLSFQSPAMLLYI